MELAAKLLGAPYMVSGHVMHGKRLGRTLGMPTINLLPEKDKLLPPNGVYLSRLNFGGVSFPGITNIGCRADGERFRADERGNLSLRF